MKDNIGNVYLVVRTHPWEDEAHDTALLQDVVRRASHNKCGCEQDAVLLDFER